MEFDVEKTIAYWLKGAEYDLGVADAMYQTEKFPYALFMGHLALEKLLKALVVKTSREHAPYTHSLPLLADKITFEIPQETKKKLVRFMEFYFESRYPEEQKNFYKKCTRGFTGDGLKQIKEIFAWLKERL
ncbi:MAG: HEPN domain-containing protein [bacterium]